MGRVQKAENSYTVNNRIKGHFYIALNMESFSIYKKAVP